MAKVPLPSDAELPDDVRQTLATLPPLNVFRMMANVPASFRGFIELATSILLRSELEPRKREIAVLRVAHVTRSIYEWTQHVTLAKMIGVSQDEIDHIGAAGTVTALDEEANFLCRVADEISRDVRLSDEALAEALRRYGVRQTAELVLCCSYFNMLSRFLESTRVELEQENVLARGIPSR